MKTFIKTIVLFFFSLSLFSLLVFPLSRTEPTPDPVKNPPIKNFWISGLQIPFIENQGQFKDKTVRFYADTFVGKVFVTDQGELVYDILNTRGKSQTSETNRFAPLRESLMGQTLKEIKGSKGSPTKINYYLGDKENWRTNIPTWQEVSLGEVYKGTELILKANRKNIEKFFTIYPQGKIADI
jgi:hypothetical protein